MGGMTVIILISPLDNIKEPFSPFVAKLISISFYLSVTTILYMLFGKTKWVGMTENHLYISNYFKSFKYTYDSIESFEEVNMLLFTKVIIHFHQPTKFGKSIYFVRSHYWKYFLEKHPIVLNTITGNLIEKVKQKNVKI